MLACIKAGKIINPRYGTCEIPPCVMKESMTKQSFHETILDCNEINHNMVKKCATHIHEATRYPSNTHPYVICIYIYIYICHCLPFPITPTSYQHNRQHMCSKSKFETTMLYIYIIILNVHIIHCI